MSEIIHSTSTLSRGPWLITREKLLELDKLVAAELEKLQEYRENVLEEAVNKHISEYVSRLSKEAKASFDRKSALKKCYESFSEAREYMLDCTIAINLIGNRRLSVSTFEEALRDPALLNEESTGFTLSIRAIDIRCNLKIPTYNNSLELDVSPDQHPIAKGLFTALKTWVNEVRPPAWRRVWLSISDGGGQWFLWFASLLIVVLYFLALAPDASGDLRAVRHAETLAILKTGVSETNQYKALELMLSYESGAIPKERTFDIPAWCYWIFFGGPILCITLSFCPKIVIGIGRGEELIKKWEKWMNIVGVSFPFWVAGTFVWPKIQQWLTNLF